MPSTRKATRRHAAIKKGKRTRGKHSNAKHSNAKRSAHHKRKRTASKRKRTAHHKRRRHTRSMRGRRGAMRGGGTSDLVPSPWIPSDLTNIYRTSVGGVMNTTNAMSGLEPDPSPLPYKGQLVGDDNMVGEILRMA